MVKGQIYDQKVKGQAYETNHLDCVHTYSLYEFWREFSNQIQQVLWQHYWHFFLPSDPACVDLSPVLSTAWK